jgi:hypothetical protein
MQKLNEELFVACLEKHEKDIAKISATISATVQNQALEIQKLKRQVKKQEEKIFGQHQVLYQLLGGLFNKKQGKMLDVHLRNLGIYEGEYEGECEGEIDDDVCIFPTTRQGDQCEERIDAIEKTIVNIGRILLVGTTADEAHSAHSAHSDSYSESESSSGSSINVKRMRNSYDLCGNE